MGKAVATLMLGTSIALETATLMLAVRAAELRLMAAVRVSSFPGKTSKLCTRPISHECF